MQWVTIALLILFFWALGGIYAFREAKSAGRSSPMRRGLGWWAIGIFGAVTYLLNPRTWEPIALTWLGVSLVLIASWLIGTAGLWGLSGGFRLWAALFGGLFILYWQYDLETVDHQGGSDFEQR